MIGHTEKLAPKLEDVLAYLPRTNAVEYRRRQVVYDVQQPSKGSYFIIDGWIKVTTVMEDRMEIVNGIF